MDPTDASALKLGASSSFDPSLLQKQQCVPTIFSWPKEYLVEALEELQAPVVDLEGFLRGDDDATEHAANLVREACVVHGFFLVINHGVDSQLIAEAYHQMDAFFKLPVHEKSRVRKTSESMWGYSGAHAHRFSSNLPWKEALSFPYHDNAEEPVVTHYFNSNLGKDFEQTGMVFQKYCTAMKELGLKLMELLGISLGVDRLFYRGFFQDGSCIMRCNYYPSCQQPSVTLGTGPHCDPTSLTILHQDHVGGLEVFSSQKWQTVRPRPDAFVINIGQTFTALTNGRYKSCLHRAMVNSCKERRSMTFFLCPKEDKVVRPPEDLVVSEGKRKYPDFTWSDLLDFTQKYYRADEATLQNFTKWFQTAPVLTQPTNIDSDDLQ